MLDFIQLAQRFDAPGVQALVLMGSHARGDAGPYSDVDLVRFVEEDQGALADAGSHLIDGVLVVVSNVAPSAVEAWFFEPQQAVDTIAGLRTARALLDRQAIFGVSYAPLPLVSLKYRVDRRPYTSAWSLGCASTR